MFVNDFIFCLLFFCSQVKDINNQQKKNTKYSLKHKIIFTFISYEVFFLKPKIKKYHKKQRYPKAQFIFMDDGTYGMSMMKVTVPKIIIK
jgi:hypothetical protein